MANWATEFDFVEGDDGGKFVQAGGGAAAIRGLLGRGDVNEATRIFEESGGAAAAALLEEAKIASSATRQAMAEMFQRARDFASAARVMELGGKTAEAAGYYEKGGDFASAAAAYQKAGELEKAGAAYERLGRLDVAFQLYQQAGAREAMAECLARFGRFMEAAALYRQLGNLHAEVEMLRGVPVTDPQRGPAVKRLAALMNQYGHGAQAIPLIIEAARANPAAAADAELQALLVHLLETNGRQEEAAKVRAAGMGAPASFPTAGGTNPSATVAPPELQQNMDNSSEAYSYLKAIPVFAELNLNDMRDLYRIAQEVGFQAGATVLEQGVLGPGLIVIVQGNVDILSVGNTGVKLLNTLGAGAYVGEIGLIREAPTSARVVAKTPVRALLISRDRFNHYLYSHEAAALRIYRLFTNNLADRVRALSAQK